MGVMFGSIGSAGCFTGTGADGLPCRTDSDCGLSLRCNRETGCCGGPCQVDVAATDGTVATMASTDESASDVSTVGTETGVEPVCGNDVVETGEACDPGSNADGPRNTPECDGDCTVPVCGDAWINPATSPPEACDEGIANRSGPFTTCDEACQHPLFYDPMDSERDTTERWQITNADSRAPGTPDPMLPSSLTNTWHFVDGWWSGNSAGCEEGDPVARCAGGQAQLELKECVSIADIDGDLVLSFEHEYAFSTGMGMTTQDGAVVLLTLFEDCNADPSVPPVARQPDVPRSGTGGYSHDLGCDCFPSGEVVCNDPRECTACAEFPCLLGACYGISATDHELPNPLAGRSVFRDQPERGLVRSEFVLDEASLQLSEGVRAGGFGLRFVTGYDCRQRSPVDSWKIHRVAVWRSP